MRHPTLALAMLGASVLVGCADPGRATAPTADASLTTGEHVSATVRVVMTDDCDPASFNEVIGPGTCSRPGPGTRC